MACEYNLNGRTFTKMELEDYIKSNPQELQSLLENLTRVTTVDGQEMIINSSDIITYSTEVGNVNYFRTEDGNLVMLKDIIVEPLTEKQLQEREDYAQELEELNLTQDERTVAETLFALNQDFEDAIDFQANVSFTSIDVNLRELKEKLESKYSKWKLANRGNTRTAEYKAKNLEFYTAIKELEDKIQNLNTTDAQRVYDFLKDEYRELKDAINNFQDSSVKNDNLMDRLNFLYSNIVGEDLKGNMTDTWDFTSFPDFEKELFRPVKELKNLLDTLNNNRIYELVRNLPSFAMYKVENNFTEDEFRDIFNASAKEKLKDINLFQQWALGLNSNDDSIFAEALMDMYHRDIAIAKNPMRQIGKRMAELNEELKKEGFNFDLLKEKNERGVDTRLLISLYTSKFTKERLPQFFNLVRNYRDTKNHASQDKAKAYKDAISWLKINTDVIDFSKIPAIANLYANHPKLSKYFQSNSAAMTTYENGLKARLGKEYDKLVDSSVRKIEDFLERDNHQFTNNPKYYDMFYYENNPFEFIQNYNNNPFAPIPIGPNFYRFNLSSYIEYIPKSTIKNVNTGLDEDTGYYSSTFRDNFMNNPKAYELWELMVDSYRSYINSTYMESGQNLSPMSWGKLNSDLTEVILQNSNSLSGMGKIGKALIDTWKDSWYFTQHSGDPTFLKSNYYDNSEYEVNTYSRALQNKSLKTLMDMAKEQGIPTRQEKDIKKYKIELANDIASKMYSDSKSGDMVKITLALLELSAIQRARIEGQVAAEMLVDKHKSMMDRHGNVGGRSKSNAKIDNWKAANIYNTDEGRENVNIKTFGKRLSEFEQNLKSILEGMLDEFKNGEDISFSYAGEKYKRVKGNYQVFNAQNKMSVITEADFYKAMEKYVDTTVEGLGDPMTMDSAINGLISNMAKKAFLINPVSGFFNRNEGKLTNMTNDLTGNYWTPGNNDYSEKFLTFANILKLAPEKVAMLQKNHYLQLQTLQQLIEEMNILQDRKNEVEKKEKESTFGKARVFFNWFAFAIDNPEFKNQATIIVNMLQDVKVKDNNGKEYPFFDKDTMSFTLYEPGTLNIKPEFTTYNESFSNFLYDTVNVENNRFYIVKERISDAISQIQGNYSNTDSIMMRHQKGWGGVAWGKVFSTFMRWFPSHANQRFGVRNRSFLQNKIGQKGRLRYLWDNPYVGSTYVSGMLAVTLGPIGATMGAFPMLIGMAKSLYNKYVLKKDIGSQVSQIKVLAGFLVELLQRTLSFPLKMVKVNTNALGNKLSGDRFLRNLSEQDKGAVKALAQELAIALNVLFLTLILKALLHGGSGDDDEDKMLHNFIDNNGNRFMSNLSIWTNPYQLVNDNTQFALLRTVKNVYKTMDDMRKLYEGDKIDERRPIMNILKEQPILPIPSVVTRAVVKGEYPGFDEKEYQNNQWFDRYTKTPQWRDEQKYKRKRSDYKEAMTEYLKSQLPEEASEEELKEIERKVRSRMNKKDMKRKKDEDFGKALDRINLDTNIFE